MATETETIEIQIQACVLFLKVKEVTNPFTPFFWILLLLALTI